MKPRFSLVLRACLFSGCALLIRETAEAKDHRLITSVEYQETAVANKQPAPNRSVLAKEISSPVKVDGILDEPCWQEAEAITDFVQFQAPEKKAAVPTQARVAFSPDALFLGITCDEPDMQHLVANCTTHDGNVWNDDCVEFWLDVNLNRRQSFHFLVNALGVVNDLKEWDEERDGTAAAKGGETRLAHGDDAKWNCPCEVKTVRAAAAWTVEMKIPAQGLGLAQIVRGSSWGFNVARTRRSGGVCELTSWTGLFITPIAGFGTLTLGKSNFAFEILSTGGLCEGPNILALNVANLDPGAKELALATQAVSQITDAKAVNVTLAPAETKKVALPYVLKGTGCAFTLTITATEKGATEKVFSRLIDGKIADLLKLGLDSTEFYLGEQKRVKGSFSVNLVDAELHAACLTIEALHANGQVLLKDRLEHLQQRKGLLTLDLSELKQEGSYTLKLSLLDGTGKLLAEKKVSFNLVEPPF